jgi:methyl-accepting chemotaxis protein
MKILAKLLIGFLAVAALCATVGIVGISQMSSLEKELLTVTDNSIPSLSSLYLIEANLLKIKAAIRSMSNEQGLDNKDYFQRQVDNIAAAREAYRAELAKYKALPFEKGELKLFNELEPLITIAVNYNDNIIKMVEAAQAAAGEERAEERAVLMRQVFNETDGNRAKFDDMLKKLIELIRYDEQYYGVDLPHKAIASAQVGIVILIIVAAISFLVALVLGLFLGTSIARSLRRTVEVLDKVGAGDISDKMEVRSNDEFKQIAASLNSVSTNVGQLIDEAGMLTKAAVEGRLQTRGDAAKFKGGYRAIVEGVNKTLDAVIGPLNVTAKYVDDISKGVIPPTITDTYNGDFNIIKNNLNAVVKMMNDLLRETDVIIKAAADGELDKRANADLFLGGWNKLVVGVNDTITNIVDPLMVTADYVDKVAKGVIPPEITTVYKGQYNIIKNNLNAVVKMMNDLLRETDVIIKAAADGELDKRANADLFLGGWNRLVAGVNDTITNIVDPLMVTAEYVDKVSKGVIPPEIATIYKGQYNLIKNNLNAVVKMMSDLLRETDIIIRAAADGELDKRANAELFLGGWNKLVAGVNDTITNIVNPLMVTADYVDKISKGDIPTEITTIYKGQYNLIKNNLNACIRAVNALVSDAAMLAQAAVEGKLATRAEAGKHSGDFRKIVEGVNRTLDLVIDPVNETIAVLKRLADGDLTLLMTGDYRGDFDILKTALNGSLESINDILGQVNVAVEQVTEGSGQVSSASQALSQGASEQASSLEEITSSITEIAGQTRQNTENAVQVNGLAKTARDDAEQGNVQMKDLVSAMNDINTSAEEIKKIVKAIDDISFQINLLALNANVEAARAGKYGKGFAVVAEEVRNLAVRSANSVKDTTRMVDEAISNIGRGNSLVDVTAKQLGSIVDGAAKVATLAEEVSTASKEQSLGLEQISTGLTQIDQVTQANTASSEQSASAAEELSSQSQQLKAMLGRFKLRARETKMSNQDVMQLLRSELSRQQHHGPAGAGKAPVHAGAGKPAGEKKFGAAPKVNPADIISLDDDNFGKF